MQLIDQRTPDGSRHFARLPQTASWTTLREHAQRLPGAVVVRFVDEAHVPPQLGFHFRGQSFSLDAHKGLLRFYVRDPLCSDLILFEAGRHFEQLLQPTETAPTAASMPAPSRDQTAPTEDCKDAGYRR